MPESPIKLTRSLFKGCKSIKVCKSNKQPKDCKLKSPEECNHSPLAAALELDDVNQLDTPIDIEESLESPLYEQSEFENRFIELAVTVNISPSKLINKKVWKYYTHEKQRGILTRIENRFRQVTPSVLLRKIYFEECPKAGVMHFHAWYCLPREFVSEMEVYWERHNYKNAETKVPWRIIETKEIWDEAGWTNYITKDQDKEAILQGIK